MNGFVVFSQIALWVLMLILYGAVYLLYRHLGNTILATSEEENRLGPSLNLNPPLLLLNTTDNVKVHLGEPSEKPRIVVFAAAGCQACEMIKPDLRTLGTEFQSDVQTVVVFNGSEAEVHEFASACGMDVLIVQDSQFRQSKKWKIPGTPYALKLDLSGRIEQKRRIKSRTEFLRFYHKGFPTSKLPRTQMENSIADHLEASLDPQRDDQR